MLHNSITPPPPVAPRRKAGRPRVHPDPAPGQAPTAEQLRQQKKRDWDVQAYHKDQSKSREKAQRWYAAQRAAKAAMMDRLRELEAQAAATASAAVELLRIAHVPPPTK